MKFLRIKDTVANSRIIVYYIVCLLFNIFIGLLLKQKMGKGTNKLTIRQYTIL